MFYFFIIFLKKKLKERRCVAEFLSKAATDVISIKIHFTGLGTCILFDNRSLKDQINCLPG